MTGDNGLAEALAAQKARDDESERKVASWRDFIKTQIAANVPQIREQMGTLIEPDPRVPEDVRVAIQALVAMVATQGVVASLQHQMLIGGLAGMKPAEKQAEYILHMDKLTRVIAEESSTIMDLLVE